MIDVKKKFFKHNYSFLKYKKKSFNPKNII